MNKSSNTIQQDEIIKLNTVELVECNTNDRQRAVVNIDNK